jgi:hypothetical protein
MNTFRPVNTSLAPDSYAHNGEETTPTTPRPDTAPSTQPQPISRMDDARTPTRATFGALANQRPLPAQPFPAAISVPQNVQTDNTQSLDRGDSQYSNKSRNSEDHDMDDSDDGGEGNEDGSDDESVNADGTRSKKKKSQRFYCTEYPPCTLSFTRSEHLARHIRYEPPHNISFDMLIISENTLVNVPSNVIARVDSLALTICDSTHRQCMSTKRSLQNPWLQLELDFRDKCAQIESAPLEVDLEPQLREASQAKSEVINEILCLLRVSALLAQHSARGKMQEDVHQHCRWLALE